MAQKEVKQWITMNGKHIPIFEGESKADAVKRALGKSGEKVGSKKEEGSRSRVYKEQLKDVQEDIKQFEDTPKSLRSKDYDEKLAALKKKESDLKSWASKEKGSKVRSEENTMANRNKLKKQIDDYVKAHPNPTEADRKKVSEMRDKYNAVMKEEKDSLKKRAAKIQEESDRQKKKEALMKEHYKLSKKDEDNIPDRDARLNTLEKQIREMEIAKEKQIAQHKEEADRLNSKEPAYKQRDDYENASEYRKAVLRKQFERNKNPYKELVGGSFMTDKQSAANEAAAENWERERAKYMASKVGTKDNDLSKLSDTQLREMAKNTLASGNAKGTYELAQEAKRRGMKDLTSEPSEGKGSYTVSINQGTKGVAHKTFNSAKEADDFVTRQVKAGNGSNSDYSIKYNKTEAEKGPFANHAGDGLKVTETINGREVGLHGRPKGTEATRGRSAVEVSETSDGKYKVQKWDKQGNRKDEVHNSLSSATKEARSYLKEGYKNSNFESTKSETSSDDKLSKYKSSLANASNKASYLSWLVRSGKITEAEREQLRATYKKPKTSTQKQISKDLDTKEKQIAQHKAEADKLNGERSIPSSGFKFRELPQGSSREDKAQRFRLLQKDILGAGERGGWNDIGHLNSQVEKLYKEKKMFKSDYEKLTKNIAQAQRQLKLRGQRTEV